MFFAKPAAVLTALLLTATPSLARKHRSIGQVRAVSPESEEFHASSTAGSAFFDQYIDHNNPDLGTFQQFYYWSSEFYQGPGSPVILFTPGESAAKGFDGYLTTDFTTGVVAQEIGAAVIVLEHRYWGKSSPYTDLTIENLQYLTLNNSISDLTHFAKTVQLPFDTQGSSTPDKAAWVIMGGSYSGALSAWTASTQPGTFWAYHASSAPVEAIENFWQYFVPVEKGMPANCSKDVSLVINHVDSVLESGTADEQYALKEMFGLGALEHNDDFATVLADGPWLWQGNQFYNNTGFFKFCDAVEGVASDGSVPGAEGVGLETALANWANWVNTTIVPWSCYSEDPDKWQYEYSVGCYDSYDPSNSEYTDISVSNSYDRQWEWLLCNEPLGYWQDGPPSAEYPIVSRLINDTYWERQCRLMFPTENGYTVGVAEGKTEDEVNAFTGGWNITQTRLLYVNGEFDPWREAGVSSDYRPGGPLASTTEHPVIVVPGGFHCSDMVTSNGEENADVKTAIDSVVAQMVTWVKEFPKSNN